MHRRSIGLLDANLLHLLGVCWTLAVDDDGGSSRSSQRYAVLPQLDLFHADAAREEEAGEGVEEREYHNGLSQLGHRPAVR